MGSITALGSADNASSMDWLHDSAPPPSVDDGWLSSLGRNNFFAGGLAGLATVGAYAFNPGLGMLVGGLSAGHFISNDDTVRTLYGNSAADRFSNSFADGYLLGFNGGAFGFNSAVSPWLRGAVAGGGFGYGTTQATLDGKSPGDTLLSGLSSGVQAWGVGNLQKPISGALTGWLGDAALPLTRAGLWGGSSWLAQDGMNGDVDYGRVGTTALGGGLMTAVGSSSLAAINTGSAVNGGYGVLNAQLGGIGASLGANGVSSFFSDVGNKFSGLGQTISDYGQSISSWLGFGGSDDSAGRP